MGFPQKAGMSTSDEAKHMETPMSLLRVENLSAGLIKGAAIVDGISFGIANGETFALLGESGSGKSMTALSLMRLLPDGVSHHSGSAMLDGVDVFGLPEREMRSIRGKRMAMIFQEPGLCLDPVMTVGSQIAEVLKLHGISAGVTELLESVGIPDAARRAGEYPFQLSGGMKQRVMIAMALAGNPSLLIADEPTTALDVTIQAQVLQLLRERQRMNGMAMLLITHDLGVVSEMAHRIAVMYAGQVVEMADRRDLFEHPLHPYTRKLFDALPGRGREKLSAIPGNVPPPGSVNTGCRFAPRCEQAWDLCHAESPRWTEIDGQGVRCHLYDRIEDSGSRIEEDKKAPLHPQPSFLNPDSSILNPESPILRVKDLCVHFPIRKGIMQRVVGHVKAVDGISMEIAGGKTLALVGESGCGKTTLGKALLNLIPATSGSISFGGNPKSAMQMVFQDPYASLNPKMRIAEILEEGMGALGVGGSRAERQSRIDDLLSKVGLDASAKWRYPHEFSGGQRQRIAIARALAVSPALLICDEPTSALDVSVQAQILNLLKELQDALGLGYLFITHNLAVVEFLAHEVCVMYLGRIVESGRSDAVLKNPLHPYTRALLSAVPGMEGRPREPVRISGDLPSPANPPVGCHFAPRCSEAMEICNSVYPEETLLDGGHVVRCHLVSSSAR